MALFDISKYQIINATSEFQWQEDADGVFLIDQKYSNTFSWHLLLRGDVSFPVNYVEGTTEELIKITMDIMATLELRGWTQDHLRLKGKLCLIGAATLSQLNFVTSIWSKMSPALREWIQQFSRFIKDDATTLYNGMAPVADITTWNDDPSMSYSVLRDKLDDFLRELKGR